MSDIQTLARETADEYFSDDEREQSWHKELVALITTALTTALADSERQLAEMTARLDEISTAVVADEKDLEKMRDGTKTTRAGLVSIIVYQNQDLKELHGKLAEMTRERNQARENAANWTFSWNVDTERLTRARDAALANAKTWERNWNNVVSESVYYCQKWNTALADAARLREALQRIVDTDEDTIYPSTYFKRLARAALSPQPKGGDTPLVHSLKASKDESNSAEFVQSELGALEAPTPQQLAATPFFVPEKSKGEVESGFDDASKQEKHRSDCWSLLKKGGGCDCLGFGRVMQSEDLDKVPAAPAQPETPTPEKSIFHKGWLKESQLNEMIKTLTEQRNAAREATAEAQAGRDEALAHDRRRLEELHDALATERTARQAAEKERDARIPHSDIVSSHRPDDCAKYCENVAAQLAEAQQQLRSQQSYGQDFDRVKANLINVTRERDEALAQFREAKEASLIGECVEMGDDENGQPRLLIHTTRAEIIRFQKEEGKNMVYKNVAVRLTDAGYATARKS